MKQPSRHETGLLVYKPPWDVDILDFNSSADASIILVSINQNTYTLLAVLNSASHELEMVVKHYE